MLKRALRECALAPCDSSETAVSAARQPMAILANGSIVRQPLHASPFAFSPGSPILPMSTADIDHPPRLPLA